MINYLRNSNVKISIDLNPFYWRFHFDRILPSQYDPYLRVWWCQLLFLNLWMVIDNGKIVLDPLEQIEVKEEEEDHP